MDKIWLKRQHLKFTRKPKFSRRLGKKAMSIFLTFIIVITGTGLLYLFGPWTKRTDAAWYDDSWGYRKVLVIDDAQVAGSSNLTNFPVLVSLTTDTSLSANAQSDGDDIIFVDQTGDRLYHEIESYSSGTLTAWVKISSLSATTDTNIYMYYGNPSISAQEQPEQVWDSNFAMVQHFL